MDAWKEEALSLTILYRMLECNEKIPMIIEGTDYAFVGKHLDKMNLQGLIEISEDGEQWLVTSKGKEVRGKMLGIYDQLGKFEIFGTVHLNGPPLKDEIVDEDGDVLDGHHDPRFDPSVTDPDDDFGTEDMRVAMMTFLSDQMSDTDEFKNAPKLDPYRLIFMQKLAEGDLKQKDIWFRLAAGEFFKDVEEITDSQYQWPSVAEDIEDAVATMQELYKLGMLEQRKRDGNDCSECGVPLALFELQAEEEEGTSLSMCPNPECEADFFPPPLTEDSFECPSCYAKINVGQNTCKCGAQIDFSLPEGTVTEETTETTETTEDYGYDPYCVWTDPYDHYVPYGYYDPYDPFNDAAAFCLVCAVLW